MSLSIALVSRELYPFGGGEIGVYIAATARTLAHDNDVVIVTSAEHEESYRELERGGDLGDLAGIRTIFVQLPPMAEVLTWETQARVWSRRVFDAIKREFPHGGPDIVEFPDYEGDGCVTIQAARTLDPSLRNTQVVVRLYTTVEMTSVLNGQLGRSDRFRKVCDYERYSLRFADQILSAGGDVLGTYERFYGADGLAPATRVRHAALPRLADWSSDRDITRSPGDDSLRMIYLGRFERCKGVQNLVRAATSIERQDWSLTLVGADTNTGPLGVSMREQLQLMAADDPRIAFREAIPFGGAVELFDQYDLGIVPSLWECWAYVALECLAANRPMIATPVGGLSEIISDGISGWLTEDASPSALADTIETAVEQRDKVREFTVSGAPRARFSELSDEQQIRSDYAALIETGSRSQRRRSAASRPTVSVVVTYFRLHEHIGETIESIFEQTHRPLDVTVVNDGSFWEADRAITELATNFPISIVNQQNSGLGAARNFGIRQTQGKYVLPFDADNLLDPSFVERCVEVLESETDVAYVTSWATAIGPSGEAHEVPDYWSVQFLSNACSSLRDENVAGDAAALIRRSVFDRGYWYSHDLASYEDWAFYRRLAQGGLVGHAIPEPLLLYRVRELSMLREIGQPNHERLLEEIDAHVRENEMSWLSSA